MEKVHQLVACQQINFKYKTNLEYMLICSRQRLKDIQIDPKITLGGTEVNRVSEKKTLGDCG